MRRPVFPIQRARPRVIALIALISATPLASPALAQTPPASQPVRTVDFNRADVVEGAVQIPDEVIEQGRRRAPAKSLIRVRTDFDRKLLQTAESL